MGHYVGIDYGMGTTNIDLETGIRYGVIPAHAVGQAWDDSADADYGKPTCGYCGTEYGDDAEGDDGTFTCGECGKVSSEDDIYPESPLAWIYTGDGYIAEQGGEGGDIFILKSPYYTLCQFCSPCAPGAGYILNAVEDGVKAYCFGPEWFDDDDGDGVPYDVYRVDDGSLVCRATAVGE